MKLCRKILCLLVLASVSCSIGISESQADENQPLAIRAWEDNGLTIETMWDLHVGLRMNENNRSALAQPNDLELDSVKPKSESKTFHVTNSEASEYVLDRKPNQDQPSWQSAAQADDPSDNAVRVAQVPVGKPESGKSVTLIQVDGVRIVDLSGMSAGDLDGLLGEMESIPESLQKPDVVVLSSEEKTAEPLLKIGKRLTPKTILLPSGTELKTVGDHQIVRVEHNTLAVSSVKQDAKPFSFVVLSTKPATLNKELADLFAKKETSSEASQKVFAKLSIEQLNFRPSNGTHTPRWNTEHMMGRELMFFAQIYNGVDPTIPVINLNPKQMPDDYQFAHPDWTGKEEARQTQRVQAFTRRFAYLLDGMDLDQKPKGSRIWTPRSLLLQMDRHYSEHTANVVKKMELPEWPKE